MSGRKRAVSSNTNGANKQATILPQAVPTEPSGLFEANSGGSTGVLRVLRHDCAWSTLCCADATELPASSTLDGAHVGDTPPGTISQQRGCCQASQKPGCRQA